MIYWLPRIVPVFVLAAAMLLGWLPRSASQAADWIFVALLLLAMLSLMPVTKDEQRF